MISTDARPILNECTVGIEAELVRLSHSSLCLKGRTPIFGIQSLYRVQYCRLYSCTVNPDEVSVLIDKLGLEGRKVPVCTHVNFNLGR